jgi:hypothetical protein
MLGLGWSLALAHDFVINTYDYAPTIAREFFVNGLNHALTLVLDHLIGLYPFYV